METQAQPQNKNRTIWIIVGIVSGLCLIACVVGFFIFRQVGKQVSEGIKTDPSEVQAVSDKIIQYDLPPGYKVQMAMSLFVYDTVIVANESNPNSMMIMMMQFSGSANLDQQQMEEQMRQAAQQQSGQPGMQMKVVETRKETIRGEEVMVTISEGTGQGFTFRQWMTVFTGNNGIVVMIIQGTADNWDDELIANFIRSIR